MSLALAAVVALAVGLSPAAGTASAPRGGPLVASPLLSRGVRVESQPPGGQVLVDGQYRTPVAWAGGHPTRDRPSWVALEVGPGPSRILFQWTSSGNHDYRDRRFGAPVEYRIETSADSTNGVDGIWRTVEDVRVNPVRTRAHAVDFAGQRWVRMVVTNLSADVFEHGLFLDEIEVHDLSAGGDDAWVFFGDSITSSVFDRSGAHQPGFPEAIAERHPGYFPAAISAGYGSLHHFDAVDRIDEVLALNPQARVIALGFGANDWNPVAYRKDLLQVVAKVRAAGKIPVIARVPFRVGSPQDFPARLNAVVDEVTREQGLVPGPDLYSYFRANPGQLEDGLHPDAAGAREVIRRWAEAAKPLYPR